MPAAPLNTNPFWTADGQNLWSADGFYGWSADGYQPTTLAAAVTALAAAGVNVGVITYVYDPLVPDGYVITGWPPLLTSPPGSYVPLTVSQGPAPPVTQAIVPNVVGMFYVDALLAINNARLLIAPPVWVISSTVLPQYVISQSIAAGTLVNEQTQVTITVSGFTVVMQPATPVAVHHSWRWHWHARTCGLEYHPGQRQRTVRQRRVRRHGFGSCQCLRNRTECVRAASGRRDRANDRHDCGIHSVESEQRRRHLELR
jgi:hypothetical protein